MFSIASCIQPCHKKIKPQSVSSRTPPQLEEDPYAEEHYLKRRRSAMEDLRPSGPESTSTISTPHKIHMKSTHFTGITKHVRTHYKNQHSHGEGILKERTKDRILIPQIPFLSSLQLSALFGTLHFFLCLGFLVLLLNLIIRHLCIPVHIWRLRAACRAVDLELRQDGL